MVDPVLLVAACALAGAIAVVAPWPIALLVASTMLAGAFSGARRVARGALLVAAVFAIASALRVARALVRDAEHAAIAHAWVPRPSRCVVHGTIASMPSKRGVLRADVADLTLECDDVVHVAPFTMPFTIRVHDLPEGLARGDRVEVIAQLAPSRRNLNPDLGDPRPAFARRGHALSGSALGVTIEARGRGVRATIDRLRDRLRRALERFVAPDVAPIARAIVLGEEDLTEADDDAFRKSGLTHLLAVSGSHVALAVGSVVAAVRFLVLRVTWLARRVEAGRVAAALGIPFALAYEQLAGDSGSARRATAMALFVLFARACGRRGQVARTLPLSVLAAMAIDPLAPFDPSFLLSLAATLGLVVLGPALREVVDAPTRWLRAVPASLRTALSTTMAASAACAPLIAMMAGAVPIAGLVANVVAVPIGELAALPICNACAVLGALSEPFPVVSFFASTIGHATAGSLVMLRAAARVAATPSFAVLAAAMACAYVAPKLSRAAVGSVTIALLLLVEGVHVRGAKPRDVLRITVLDVGQGDALVVDLPDGRVMVIDGGGEVGSPWDPGKIVVGPVLAARRRSRIDVAVLSHPHPDHFLGLRHPLSTLSVGALWDTGEAHDGHGELGALFSRLRARHVPLVRPATLCGVHRFGLATVEVLAPCPAYDASASTNDNSFVLRVSLGARHALLVGDAEEHAEHGLLHRDLHRDLRADFLKVGHHGSRTSSTDAFLRAVSPTIAAISCGARNRFGHPHPTAMARLRSAGIRVLRTDLDGSIRWTTDGTSSVVDLGRLAITGGGW